MCNGDGIDEGACDCDGNVLDECGVCGGNNDCLPWTELTAVGGDNEITLAWFPLSGDRGRDFSLSLENVDTEAGTLDINLTNSEPVAGFQFNLEGINITGASGGSAGSNGFMISTNSTTVLGFSLTGASIPAGSGTLVSVTFDGFQESICLADAVLSDL